MKTDLFRKLTFLIYTWITSERTIISVTFAFCTVGHFCATLCPCFKVIPHSCNTFHIWKWIWFARKLTCRQNTFSYEWFSMKGIGFSKMVFYAEWSLKDPFRLILCDNIAFVFRYSTHTSVITIKKTCSLILKTSYTDWMFSVTYIQCNV